MGNMRGIGRWFTNFQFGKAAPGTEVPLALVCKCELLASYVLIIGNHLWSWL